MRTNYRQTLARISSLVSNGEITFDLLYAILVPGTTMIKRCPRTGEKRAFRLREVEKLVSDKTKLWYYSLTWEGLEEIVERDVPEDEAKRNVQDAVAQPQGARFGWITSSATIAEFSGVEMVNKLSTYPLEFHNDPEAFKASLIERGRRWASLSGMHHMQYRDTAGRYDWVNGDNVFRRVQVGHCVSSCVLVLSLMPNV